VKSDTSAYIEEEVSIIHASQINYVILLSLARLITCKKLRLL